MIKIQKYIEEKKKIYDFLLNFLEISDKNHFYKFNKFHDNKKLFSESQWFSPYSPNDNKNSRQSSS